MRQPICRSNGFHRSIEEIAMEFVLDSMRDRLGTCQEIQAQLHRYEEMASRIGRENADQAVANAKSILNMVGLNPGNNH